MHMLGVNCGKFLILRLSSHCCNHLTKWSSIQNQISSNGIINDNIDQGADAINILNDIVECNLVPTMCTMEKVGPYWI
jgi:hypothetical protein